MYASGCRFKGGRVGSGFRIQGVLELWNLDLRFRVRAGQGVW